MATTQEFVLAGMKALKRHNPTWTHGFNNRLLMFTARLLSSKALARMVARVMKPGGGRTAGSLH
jgi:hypothetical protein